MQYAKCKSYYVEGALRQKKYMYGRRSEPYALFPVIYFPEIVLNEFCPALRFKSSGLRCSIWYRVEKYKVRNEVVCCYIDKGILQVINVEDLKFATSPLRLIHIYKDRCFTTYSKLKRINQG